MPSDDNTSEDHVPGVTNVTEQEHSIATQVRICIHTPAMIKC